MNMFFNKLTINKYHLSRKIYEFLKEICDKLVLGEKWMRRRNKKKKKFNYEKILQHRLLIIFLGTICAFTILMIKIMDVMIIHQDDYSKQLAKLTYTTVSGTSTPRGRIYDRNYNIIVDNKSLKTITFQKRKGMTNQEMIEAAKKVSNHIDIDYHRITNRAKREYYYVKEKEKCDKLVTEKEREKVSQRKMTPRDLEELKIARIKEEDIAFSEEEQKIAYLFYLMNKGYTYEEKIIKSDVTDQEYAYISENNDQLNGFNTKIDWERVYPYGDTFKSML